MIALISIALTKRGCHLIQSLGDADVNIVKATVERSRHCTTTLVGEDTYLLILLLHYSKTDNEIIYFRSDANKQSKEHSVYTINLLKETLEVILQNKSQEDISDLCKDLMVDLFGGKSNDTLSSLRYIIFIKKVPTAQAFVTPERLLPTSPATRFHSQRVYIQIMVWMGIANEINPTEWG